MPAGALEIKLIFRKGQFNLAIKKGAGAIQGLTATNDSGSSAEFTPFKSGTTLKVKVKGTEDLAEYYNYGIFKVVNSFTPKNPAVRNERGFVESNPSPWDKAAQYYSDQARQAPNDKAEEEAKKQARLYRGVQKYIVGFHDLESGKDIVVDLTRNQALVVHGVIKKYEKKLDKLAFELSKQGESTSTTVSLSPIIDMDEDLSDKERENFEKAAGQPFNDSLFDGVLYEMDEAEQIENLKKAGFDVSLIGLSGAAKADEEPKDEALDIEESELPF
ncbi:hypothetical protein [Terribacillus saccharophilus]|uniref:hypothetical protein n=1 Tax=Terribacillus saccharophilus TaxID=361277 RepID=UPI003D2BAE74